MTPRRLHSDTIFSINGISFGSAIRTGSVRDETGGVKLVTKRRNGLNLTRTQS
jgi:hypothetical protein